MLLFATFRTETASRVNKAMTQDRPTKYYLHVYYLPK